jgi:excisionase family DNA binding protein
MAHDPPKASSVRLLTYDELADWLNDSVRHLRRLVDERRIPYHKVGSFRPVRPAGHHRVARIQQPWSSRWMTLVRLCTSAYPLLLV